MEGFSAHFGPVFVQTGGRPKRPWQNGSGLFRPGRSWRAIRATLIDVRAIRQRRPCLASRAVVDPRGHDPREDDDGRPGGPDDPRPPRSRRALLLASVGRVVTVGATAGRRSLSCGGGSWLAASDSSEIDASRFCNHFLIPFYRKGTVTIKGSLCGRCEPTDSLVFCEFCMISFTRIMQKNTETAGTIPRRVVKNKAIRISSFAVEYGRDALDYHYAGLVFVLFGRLLRVVAM